MSLTIERVRHNLVVDEINQCFSRYTQKWGDNEHWSFASENSYTFQMQAINCKLCGGYKASTSTHPQNVNCTCAITNLNAWIHMDDSNTDDEMNTVSDANSDVDTVLDPVDWEDYVATMNQLPEMNDTINWELYNTDWAMHGQWIVPPLNE